MVVVDDRGIIDNGRPIVNAIIVSTIDIISVHVAVHEMVDRNECPEVHRNIDGNIDAHTWTQGSPAIIIVALTPVYPCWSPLVIGNPSPAITIVVVPSAVMEWSPAPVVIRDPGIPVVCHGPITIGGIRLKVGTCIRDPDISIVGIIYPLPVG